MIYHANPGQVTYGEPIGIIVMDSFMPFPPGTPGNASTFRYPVRYRVVRGANMERLVYAGDPALYEPFLEAGRELVREGVRAVMGNCGFMVLYQDQLARDLEVPVFMSSLLQLPLIARALRPGEKVGIVTASLRSLSERHIRAATGGLEVAYRAADMEDQPHFHAAIHAERGTLDFDAVEAEVVGVAQRLVASDPSIRALLFECTDLPPYAAAAQAATGLPVFDWTTLADYVCSGLVRRRFSGFV